MKLSIPSIGSEKALKALVTSGPVTWVLGISLLYYPLVLIACAVAYVKKFKFTWYAFLGMILVAYLCARALIYQAGGGSSYRAFAAYYNAAVLLTLFLLYAFSRGIFARGGEQARLFIGGACERIFYLVSGLTIASWLVAFIVPSLRKVVSFPTPIGLAIKTNLPGILSTAQHASFTRADWGAGVPIPRSMVMAGFPTSAAMVVAALGFLALYRCSMLNNKWREAVVNLLMLVCVAMTLTRTIVVGMIIGYLATNFVRKKTNFRILIIVFIAFTTVFTASWYLSRQEHTGYQSAASFRSSSTETRMASYKAAYELAMNEGPIFGLGVKPRDDAQLKIPVGSHSTPIGMFLKGGIFAEILALLLLFIIPAYWTFAMYVRYSRAREKSWKDTCYKHFVLSFRFLLVLFPWLIFEDVDAYVFTSMLVFFVFTMIFHIDAGQRMNHGERQVRAYATG